MTFAYTARDATGKTAGGSLDAPSRKDALRRLAARGLVPVTLTESGSAAPGKAAGGEGAGRALFARRAVKLTRAHRLPFLVSLHELINSGLSAGEAVRLLSLRVQDPAQKLLCGSLWEAISEGATLSRALGAHPEVFDEATLNLIQAGEATGNIGDVLARLIEHLTRQKELQRELAASLAYPAFLLLVAVGVVLFLMFFLMPRMEPLFTSLRGELPLATRLLLGFSGFAMRYGLFIVAGVAVVVTSLWRWYRTEAGRYALDGLLIKLPAVGPFVTARTIHAFSQTLSILLENGITTAEALRMTERQIGNRVHRKAFADATARVLEGETLSKTLAKTGCFPGLVLDRLAIGENTGNIVGSLKKISATYERQVSDRLAFFTKLVGSVVLGGVFIFVGFIAFAIVSAVFELSASINK
jgi:type II secretory pathway component PulF